MPGQEKEPIQRVAQLAPLELGYEVDILAKVYSFVDLSANEYGRESFPPWGAGDLVDF